MPTVSDALTDHHRRCRDLFAQAADTVRAGDWNAFGARLVALREDLLGHFRFEEERLFPVYEEASGAHDATQLLRTQHDDIRAILWALSSASAAHDPASCQREFETLAALFQQHADREEALMYPAFERLLGAQAAAVAEQARHAAGVLDLRGLRRPEPFLRLVQSLASAPDEPLRALLDAEPLRLYAVLEEQGFSHRARAFADGSVEIVIERAAG